MSQDKVVAITVWQGRISPVFDVAEEILLYRIPVSGAVTRMTVYLEEGSVYQKVDTLLLHKVTVLICGAMSRFAAGIISSHSIEVHSFRAGGVEDLIAGLSSGSIEAERFSMPGCICKKKNKRERRHNHAWKR